MACLIHSLGFGGSQRVMALLANEFAKDPSIDVHLILYGSDAPCVYVVSDSVTVHRPAFKFDKRSRLMSTLRRLRYLRAALGRGDYDAILSFGERWNSFVMLATLGKRQNIVLSDRSSPIVKLGWVHSSLRRLLYPRAHGLLAQTNEAREMATRHGLNSRIRVIPNPINLPEPAQESGRQNTILSVGRMVSTKHYDQLIRIFASLDAKNWKLIIVGDDSQRQKHRSTLEALAESLGVADRVEFAGERTDVQSFYDRAKIFAFTSSSEGYPNVLAEALASGLPAVAYNCVAGPADLIANGKNGYLVDLFDEEGFRKRLIELVEDEDKRKQMSVRARESVMHLSAEEGASKVLSFILSEHHPSEER